MARTKSQHVELIGDTPLAGDLNVKLNALTEHRIQVMDQFGDGLPYERDRIVHETRFYMAQSAEAMLEAGKRLVILKECEPHGDFTQIVTEQLGLAERTARLVMQAAIKYTSPQLEPKRQALAVLGKTKLFELMTEDDEELAELADGGTIAGMTLDDIDRMTSRELKTALREARETHAAQQRVLTDKNQKIDDLSTKLEKKSRIQPPAPNQEAEKLRKEVSAIAFEAEAAITAKLHTAFSTLTTFTSENEVEPPYDFMAGLVCQIERALHRVREVFDLEAAPTGSERPAWLDAPEPQIQRTDA
ncbi:MULTISPECIES: DUF3102 domain-containing protein [unclassified Brenneria]|uniref:DUF3102 domain-containing protein n=1 Tax=unclassified Brenneria TaxID=2634434 RepID=UPI0029C39F95|nr:MULTISPECIES: DUF3102 domain-containing protein [unclassified Brenneria]MDX5630363.1 DUF3102 domain-containing protein [Brenneria sp. L3-3Z]MDX5697508.1 DUF3102 domain-containing protein [Brenneria sp. L4-2C]